MKKIHFIAFMILLCSLTFMFAIIFGSLKVSAAELDDDERLNALELRLKDYEITIEHIKGSITALIENEEYEYEQRLIISQQLDVMIVGLNDLLNFIIIEAENNAFRDEIDLLRDQALTERHKELLTELEALQLAITQTQTKMETSTDELIRLSVSGNSIMTDMGDNLGNEIRDNTEKTLQELNETLMVTNTFLTYVFVMLLILLAVLIAVSIGKLLQNTIFKFID